MPINSKNMPENSKNVPVNNKNISINNNNMPKVSKKITLEKKTFYKKLIKKYFFI